MSAIDSRRLLPHAAIGLAVCFGGYMLLVDGARKDVASMRLELEKLSGEVQIAEGLTDKIPVLTAALEKVNRQAETIATKGRPARDERSLYAAITSMAAEHRVRLDELNPARLAAPPTAPMQADGKPAKPVVAETAVGYTMVAIATYEDISGFIADMRTDLGFSSIRSMRLTPVQDERVRLVRAVIETEHYAFGTVARQPATADAGAR